MCAGAVYDGYHFASDVIVGALLGIVVGLTFANRETRVSYQRDESA